MAEYKTIAIALLSMAFLFLILAFWYKYKSENSSLVTVFLVGSIVCILSSAGIGFKRKSSMTFSDYLQAVVLLIIVCLMFINFFHKTHGDTEENTGKFMVSILAFLVAIQINDF